MKSLLGFAITVFLSTAAYSAEKPVTDIVITHQKTLFSKPQELVSFIPGANFLKIVQAELAIEKKYGKSETTESLSKCLNMVYDSLSNMEDKTIKKLEANKVLSVVLTLDVLDNGYINSQVTYYKKDGNAPYSRLSGLDEVCNIDKTARELFNN